MPTKKYTINSKEVSRQEFFHSLRHDCSKTVSVIRGIDGLDMAIKDFDEKKYLSTQRKLRAGHMVLFFDAGRTYAAYRK